MITDPKTRELADKCIPWGDESEYDNNFIQRNYDFTEHDDFIRNIQNKVGKDQETIPQYYKGDIVGWKIQGRRE